MRLRLVSAAFAICLLPAVVAQARGVVHDGLEYGVKLASKTLQGWASSPLAADFQRFACRSIRGRRSRRV